MTLCVYMFWSAEQNARYFHVLGANQLSQRFNEKKGDCVYVLVSKAECSSCTNWLLTPRCCCYCPTPAQHPNEGQKYKLKSDLIVHATGVSWKKHSFLAALVAVHIYIGHIITTCLPIINKSAMYDMSVHFRISPSLLTILNQMKTMCE